MQIIITTPRDRYIFRHQCLLFYFILYTSLSHVCMHVLKCSGSIHSNRNELNRTQMKAGVKSAQFSFRRISFHFWCPVCTFSTDKSVRGVYVVLSATDGGGGGPGSLARVAVQQGELPLPAVLHGLLSTQLGRQCSVVCGQLADMVHGSP